MLDNNRKKEMEENKKEQIWTMLFTVPPVILFMNIGEVLFANSNWIPVKVGLICGLGGLASWFLYSIVRSKSNLIKGATLFLLLLMLIGALVGVNRKYLHEVGQNENATITCLVCGFVSLTETDKLCGECWVELIESEMNKEGFSTMSEFIMEEQFLYFTPDSLVETVDFYTPKLSEDGYVKDLSWRPRVSLDSILAFNADYVQHLKDDK